MYDLIFYIVVIVLGLNIVIAILVADRFSDVRENKVSKTGFVSITTKILGKS